MLKSYFDKNLIEAGCDEAGRGCLAGPVYAASVILPKNYKNKWLDDSKKLSDKDRYELRPEIEEKALTWAVGVVDNVEIDKINILKASFLAMHRAIDLLKQKPELLLIDGNRFTPYKNINHQCIIKGDAKFLSIASPTETPPEEISTSAFIAAAQKAAFKAAGSSRTIPQSMISRLRRFSNPVKL